MNDFIATFKSCILFRIRVYFKRIINRMFAAKRSDIRQLVQVRENKRIDNVEFIVNSSVICHFIMNGKEYFFRKCNTHQPLNNYLNDTIHFYCEYISKTEEPDKLLKAIEEDLAVNDNYKRYKKIPEVFDRKLMYILSGVFSDYYMVGLPTFPKVEDHQEFLCFLKYSGAVLSTYWSNSYVKDGVLENGNANKQMASYILARLLGVDNLIPKVEIAEIYINGEMCIGTLMEKAEGENCAYTQPIHRKLIEKGTFLKDLTNLEYLDALCYQLDHRLDNYNVIYNQERVATSVVAFDNDAYRTFYPFPVVPIQTYAGVNTVVKGGFVNRPYIDKVFSQRVCNITREEIDESLSSYLTKVQCWALWKRIVQLKEAILKTKMKNPQFEIDTERWQMVDETLELDPKFGKTYYGLYLYDTTMIDREEEFKNLRKCM